MKIEGFALKTSKNEYLVMEQIANSLIDVYTTDSPEHATLFNLLTTAIQEMNNIKNKTGKWDYQILDEDMPEKIVKIIKLIHVEDVDV